MICLLHHSLFCLKLFVSIVSVVGFLPNAHDNLLFVHLSARGWTLLLYVDDTIIISNESEYIVFVNAFLSEQFLIYDLGHLCNFLGIVVYSISDGFLISPKKLYPKSSCSCGSY